jgi:hypothetical protein
MDLPRHLRSQIGRIEGMKCVGNVARVGEARKALKIRVGTQEE